MDLENKTLNEIGTSACHAFVIIIL